MASCLEKQQYIVDLFADAADSESMFTKLIELGRTLTPFPQEYKTPDHRVSGCQSNVYLHAALENGKVTFTADADALIAAGLIWAVLYVYNDETPETILTCEPTFVKTIGLAKNLTPGRANGLASMILHIKKAALRLAAVHSKPEVAAES